MLKIPGTILTAIAWATVFLAAPVICADTNSRDAGNGMQSKLYKVFDSNKNAIVKVYAQKKIPFLNKEGKEEFRATLDVGTGFLIGKDGITATSAYITYGAEKIWIEWCGKLFDANLIGFDPLTTLSIAKISGTQKNLKRMKPEGHEVLDEKTAKEIKEEARKGPFRFSDCDIPAGAEIEYIDDPAIRPTVVDDRRIEYNGETTSLSKLAQTLRNSPYPVQGTLWFRYNGEILNDRRNRIEKGKD